jgi:RNA polymerase sigma-70 factor (ECF subfamily)
MDDARQAAEGVARASYGRLVALLASRSRDIAAAEDALVEAFRTALEVWPLRGVPERPDAWLLTVARRMLGHLHRHRMVREAAAGTLALLHEEMQEREPDRIPDQRLKLLFVCAHPAIDASVRTPLMLQTVLGLEAERIAGAFLTSPSAMSQRLVRAKAKIRDAGIRFEEPDPDDLPARLDAVLSAVYAAYGTAWDATPGAADGGRLGAEANYLGRLLVGLLPNEPEVLGLLALMLYCEARAKARRDANGAFVPLDRQDHTLWSRDLVIEAEGLLTAASRIGRFGRFQTEAAIQSVHVQRPFAGRTNTRALVMLHDLLAEQAPSIGALVSRAAVHGEAFGAEAGLRLLDALEPARIEAYQPYWAVRAHLLREGDQDAAAEAAFTRAMGLTEDPAVRAHLAAEAAAGRVARPAARAPEAPSRAAHPPPLPVP